MSHAEIFTSTGSLGLEMRKFYRMYLNWSYGVIDDIRVLERLAKRVESISNKQSVTRYVLRALVSDSVVEQIPKEPDGSNRYVEAFVPISGHPNIWLGMFARNVHRTPIVSEEVMIKETTYEPDQRLPVVWFENACNSGYTFATKIDPHYDHEIQQCWGPVFGWSLQQVQNLRQGLTQQQSLDPKNRSIWFTGAYQYHHIVSLAMAERLDIPLGNGQHISIVENTEWYTGEHHRGAGLMKATIVHLNAQIIRDLKTDKLTPTIIAETNFKSRSDKAASASGMRIPSRIVSGLNVPQILKQNVEIGDGYEPRGLRDFTMMYLPEEAIKCFYTDDVLPQILDERKI